MSSLPIVIKRAKIFCCFVHFCFSVIDVMLLPHVVMPRLSSANRSFLHENQFSLAGARHWRIWDWHH